MNKYKNFDTSQKVLYFTNIAPSYRQLLWESLVNNKFNIDLHFYFGTNKKSGIQLINFNSHDLKDKKQNFHNIKNLWLFKRILIWQFGVIYKCIFGKFDKVIFLGDMYCISTWIASLILRFRRKKIIFWGHGFYGNENFLKKKVRKTFFKLADFHLVYNKRAKKMMIKQNFNEEKIFVIYNSLNYKKHLDFRKKRNKTDRLNVLSCFENPYLPLLIYIGRITKAKKLEILIKAINNKILKNKINLIILGSGSEILNLKKQVKNFNLDPYVSFYGPCYDEDVIAKFFSFSDLCVSPGSIGLTAIHSLSYGVPVCSHDDFSIQGPEFESIIDSGSGFFFLKDNFNDLAKKINVWLNKEKIKVKANSYQVIDEFYNPYYQIEIFKRVLKL